MIRTNEPIAIATWKHGFKATDVAMDILKNNGSALDAVEVGVRVTEADPKVRTVGYGGFTDQDGNVDYLLINLGDKKVKWVFGGLPDGFDDIGFTQLDDIKSNNNK